jgi:hypothetical protein
MSFRDYLHEKAEESRHNETSAYLMFLAGAVFFVGGILETLSLDNSPEWFLFIPYKTELSAGTALGLSMIVSSFILMILGIIVGINYSKDRSWYMKELQKACSMEEAITSKQSIKNQQKRGKRKS